MLKKIVRDSGFAGFGEIVYMGSIYVANIVISRYLGAEGVGVYAQAIAIVAFTALLARFGFDVAILRFLSLYLARNNWKLSQGIFKFSSIAVIVASIILGGSVLFASDFIANTIFKDPQLSFVLPVFAATIPFVATTIVWLNAIQAFQRIGYRILIEKISVPLISTGSIALFLYLGWSWNGLLISTLLATATGSISAYFICRNFLKNPNFAQLRIDKSNLAIKKWLQFSYPIFFSHLLALALTKATILMLGYFQDSSTVGVYEIASKVILLMLLPLNISNLVFAPLIGEMHAKGENTDLERMFKLMTKWVFAATILIFLVLTILSEPILAIFGPEFSTGNIVLAILAWGYLVNASTGAVGWMLTMTGHSKVHLFNSLLSLILVFGFSLVLIPRYGIVGAAIVVSFVQVLINIVRLVEVSHLFRMHPYRWDFIKPILAGSITMGAVYLLQKEMIYASIPTFWSSLIIAGSICCCYVGLLILFHWSQLKSLPRLVSISSGTPIISK